MKEKFFNFVLIDLIVLADEIAKELQKFRKDPIANECIKTVNIIKKRINIYNLTAINQEFIMDIQIALTKALSVILEIKDNNSLVEEQNITAAFEKCYTYLSQADDTLGSNMYEHICDKPMDEYETFNSESFYNKKISEINTENDKLVNELDLIKEKLKTTTSESEKTRKLLEQKEQELIASTTLMNKYEKEKLQNEKINDAKNKWNGKIKTSFDNLKTYIKPIKDEHKRLKLLFRSYMGLSIILICCLFIIECIICCKLAKSDKIPTWETYVSLIAPIPIAMGGLWGFVTLMHKVQRQLVILAKQIHEIEYVEGLLLTANELSLSVNESMNKINSAIDKLLDNHLSSSNVITEELSLEKEEKKDTMPYEEVIKIIKEVAGLAKSKE